MDGWKKKEVKEGRKEKRPWVCCRYLDNVEISKEEKGKSNQDKDYRWMEKEKEMFEKGKK